MLVWLLKKVQFILCLCFRFVKPTEHLDSTIYLCRKEIQSDESDELHTQDKQSQATLISGLDDRYPQTLVGMFNDSHFEIQNGHHT